MAYSLALDGKRFAFRYSRWIARNCDFIRSIFSLYFAMGSCSTNNSLQSAPVFSMAGGESDLSPSTSHTVMFLADLPTTSQAVIAGSEGGISPHLASFIAQTVQAALATKRSAHGSPPVSTTPTQSTAVEVPHSSVSVSMANSRFGGVSLSLGSSTTNFLATGTGLSQQGRPAFSFNMVVPSFVSTFANPSMSASVSSPNVSSLQNDASRDVADRSAVLPDFRLSQRSLSPRLWRPSTST